MNLFALGLVGEKMAAITLRKYHHGRILRRNRIFRDQTNPFDVFYDQKIFLKFRFHGQEFLIVTEKIDGDIEFLSRRGRHSAAELSWRFAPRGCNCVVSV